MRTIHSNKKIGVILILISALGYGLMPIFSVFAIRRGTPTVSLLFIRFSIATLLLWPYIFITKKKYKMEFKTLLYLITICLFGFTIASISIYSAYEKISGSIATLILFTHPFFVWMMEIYFKRKPFKMKNLFAVLAVIMGLAVVLYQKNLSLSLAGIGLSFLSSITYGIFCFGLSNKNVQALDGIAITAYMTTITMLTSGISCLVKDVPLIPTDHTSVITGLMLAIFSTLIASVTFYEGLSIIGPSSATLISSFEPVFVVMLSGIFLHEVISSTLIIGGSIIIIGIIIMEYQKPQKIMSKRKIS
ncbi:MAG: EamA family transporter [Clostridia bacterium]|nr:EamA family transporter [Clostridia bacterium]